MKNWRSQEWRIEEGKNWRIKKSRWIEEMKREWIKEWRSQEAKNEEGKKYKNKEGKNEWRIEEIQERSQEVEEWRIKKARMNEEWRSQEWRTTRSQEPRRTPRTKNHTRTTSNTSQSSIPPYSTNPSQLFPSLYNSSRTFEPIQTFYNFLIYIILQCFHKV